jgi:predicted  nucleic acid-binding Zn-ribbon protein
MAMARKCDRCGALYEQYSTRFKEAVGIADINGFMFVKRRSDSSDYITEDRPRDLCPDCTKSILAWLLEKGGADNDQG